ncbi:L10-interacting MYB domain-containing protein [Senna tora]|uniref:L10-interacting MYB domain-containing protein n=1 Tax=Senna tora TaxID=362788 RepID=A0A834STI0_9FABA|nr:L10-interacting MYB domain-containing protein [Senna tora]
MPKPPSSSFVYETQGEHTRFRWDAETNIVTADEEAWTSYILAHPEAARFKKHGMEHYNLLSIIFNRNTTSTSLLHDASTQDPSNSQEVHDLENEHLNGGVNVDVDKDNHHEDVVPEIIERITHSGKCTSEIPKPKRKRESMTHQMRDALQTWAKASKAIAEVQLEKAERYKAKRMEASIAKDTSSDYSIAKCIFALNEIDDVSDDIYVKAMNKFIDATWREMFMCVPIARKKAWLDRLL